MKIPEFIRLLQCFKGLDYVLIKTTSMYVPEVTICSCDMNSLNHLLLTSYTNDTKYISYQYKIEKHFYQTCIGMHSDGEDMTFVIRPVHKEER